MVTELLADPLLHLGTVIGVFDRIVQQAADGGILTAAVLEVEEWLSTREDRAKEPSQMLLALGRADNWKILKVHPHELRVSWSDGY
jgi:hypothetical protein